ncbi:MAG: oxidoreductase [Chitinophagales bacterium]|nr:MAG: oxidoreductase [Chitinophagales bacterium]
MSKNDKVKQPGCLHLKCKLLTVLNPNPKSALLIGATGLIGSHCLRFLLESTCYEKVIVLTRRATQVNHPKLQEHIIDFDRLASFRHLIKADDGFCCLGTTLKKAGSKENFRKVDFIYPLETARILAENGAGQYLIVTAMGAHPSSLFFYNRVKGAAEEAIKQLPFSGIHIFRPSLLQGHRNELRLAEQTANIVFKVLNPIFIGPLKRYRAIEGRVVARAMEAVACHRQPGIHVYESDQIQDIYDKIPKTL